MTGRKHGHPKTWPEGTYRLVKDREPVHRRHWNRNKYGKYPRAWITNFDRNTNPTQWTRLEQTLSRYLFCVQNGRAFWVDQEDMALWLKEVSYSNIQWAEWEKVELE